MGYKGFEDDIDRLTKPFKKEEKKKGLTYRQLRSHIEVMDGMQLEQDVTVYLKIADEYFPVTEIDFANESDDSIQVLGIDHPFLIIDA